MLRAMNDDVGTTWAGSHRYAARALVRPRDVAEIQALVRRGGKLRALGSRHSFSDLADTSGDLVSLDAFAPDLVVAAPRPAAGGGRATATFATSLRYGDLAVALHACGVALANMASLPHISVAGSVATGTHGSGDRVGTLATQVRALDFVDGRGDVVHLQRGDDGFAGAVVALGALGIVVRLTLDVEPAYDVRQDVYEGLPWDAALAELDAITSSAYSVSLFTSFTGDEIPTVWLKSRMDEAAPPATLFGARPARADRHMVAEAAATSTTQQGGVPGPWHERLPHFRTGFTPSVGEELQSEYIVPRPRARDALRALRKLGDRIAPLLYVSEVRTMAADDQWLSPAYATPAVGVHFTWKKKPDEVRALLPVIEDALLPMGARPHWGKIFVAGVERIEALYPRVADFRALVAKHDPDGLFRNDFLARVLGL